MVLSNLFYIFHAQTTLHIGKTENHQHLKTLKHVSSASGSRSYEDYMAIYMLSTIFQPYHFVGVQIGFVGY